MNEELWHKEQQKFHQRMMEFGATPRLSMKNADGSIFLSHADFNAFEGEYEKEPFLRLHLCTGHVGRIYRKSSDGSALEGVLRPGSFGLTLPQTEAEGYWPRTQALAIMIKSNHLSSIGDNELSLDQLYPAATVLHRDPLVSSVMYALMRDAEAHGLTSAFFDHGLELILKRLSEYRHERPSSQDKSIRPLSKTHLSRSLELIEDRVGSDIRVNELALECDQNVRSFTRSFRASTGFAPYEYLTMRRMEKSKELLRSNISVTEVAMLVGYSNPSKFSAAFRRFYGCSPSEWQRDQR